MDAFFDRRKITKSFIKYANNLLTTLIVMCRLLLPAMHSQGKLQLGSVLNRMVGALTLCIDGVWRISFNLRYLIAKNAKKLAGVSEILLPGERGNELSRKKTKCGSNPISRSLLVQLEELVADVDDSVLLIRTKVTSGRWLVSHSIGLLLVSACLLGMHRFWRSKQTNTVKREREQWTKMSK